MTDNEILKVLECCHNGTCSMCPYVNEGYCGRRMISGSLNLIKKQQVEIDRLTTENERVKTKIYKMAIDKALAEKARAEAIKEFADKLKAKAHTAPVSWYEMYMTVEKIVTMKDIDNLVKEMVGADNE